MGEDRAAFRARAVGFVQGLPAIVWRRAPLPANSSNAVSMSMRGNSLWLLCGQTLNMGGTEMPKTSSRVRNAAAMMVSALTALM